MWLKNKWSRRGECLGRPQGLVLLLLPGLLALTLYLLAGSETYYDRFQYLASFHGYSAQSDEVVEGYLVYNAKCHMLSKNPLDPSIMKLVKREKFEPCSSTPPLTGISRESNGSVYLVVNPAMAKHHKEPYCCWAPITRPTTGPVLTSDKDYDSKINIGECEPLKDRVLLPKSIEVVKVTCTKTKPTKSPKSKVKGKLKSSRSPSLVYENVHAVLNPERVRERLQNATSEIRGINNSTQITSPPPPPPTTTTTKRNQLSVLMLGIDSVSRLNFHRSMPATRAYFEDRGWFELRGYNKMGDNTFPNLMAFLTGQNQTVAYSACKPKTPYGLDNCSLIWYNFRDAGYVTAYGEDHATISTFNYLKVGFVDPPTDYYLRPFVIASEKHLKTKQRFGAKYCTGPELNIDRIFDYAVDFAKSFLGNPYFGFFWTNGISHESMNGPSSIDAHFLAKLQNLENSGVLNDSMIVVLSDHGMRYGDIRSTFVGWYEERLPFIYVWLPEWFREQEPEAYAAMRVNQNRLTSPYDLYETLRDVLQRAGGQAVPSSGCPQCSSLFKPAPKDRGCSEAGVAQHWCTCTAFQPSDPTDKVVIEGAQRFVDHMDDIVKRYKSKKGVRLCAKPRLKRIHRVNQVVDLERNADGVVLELFYLLEVSPGDGKFETTIRYHGPGNWTIRDEEVSRINLYGHSAKCLDEGYKQYCHCTSLDAMMGALMDVARA
ncbi:uncharacterized protein LOC100121316 isoform X1 [Nasonia vitripennis]|uniref:Uncharacterized protein n=1 Tax=Nasonia vitripennis TaxID=7425 RepID=A0A7M7H827_NASVI|nr:uncharacterized protein LOC100121316 isoform X1 [Nasonia vitripennis]